MHQLTTDRPTDSEDTTDLTLALECSLLAANCFALSSAINYVSFYLCVGVISTVRLRELFHRSTAGANASEVDIQIVCLVAEN